MHHRNSWTNHSITNIGNRHHNHFKLIRRRLWRTNTTLTKRQHRHVRVSYNFYSCYRNFINKPKAKIRNHILIHCGKYNYSMFFVFMNAVRTSLIIKRFWYLWSGFLRRVGLNSLYSINLFWDFSFAAYSALWSSLHNLHRVLAHIFISE